MLRGDGRRLPGGLGVRISLLDDWEGDGGPLDKRFSPERSPKDDALYQALYSTLLAYMAKHGFDVESLYEGIDDLLASAYAFHADRAALLGLRFEDFIGEKLALKRKIRQLKELGLTESLAVGYRLSPRGHAFVNANRR